MKKKIEMKKKNGIFTIFFLALMLAFAFFITITITGADVTKLNVNPEVVVQDETLSIYGKASLNEEVWINSSFEISLPVSDAKYSREFNGIYFPAGEKAFSVTAENIKNIRISLRPVFGQTVEYPLEGPKKATNGTATISISFPVTWENITINIEGRKNVKIYGDAADDANSVTLNVDMSIKVTADSNGDFSLNITTEGVPTGEFFITAGEIEKTVSIVLTEPTPTPTSPPSPSPTPSPTPTPPIPTPVFDTGSPENPYPSICGTHHGTIKPNQTITVSKLYTYPCPGTGGHTERVKIWNDTRVIVEANWTGYRGDWHNITFDEITLEAGETYNYTIHTGSYPQIIHEHTANVTGGTITCTQFTDANGKVYRDWIPAIILISYNDKLIRGG